MFDVAFKNGKYETIINGKKVTRTNKSHMDYVIKKAMQNTGINVSMPVRESRFTINQRFGFVTDMVNMLIKGDQPSVVITGPGGLGKSYTVMEALTNKGFKDITLFDEFSVGSLINRKKTFQVVKGYSTPKGLYRTLFENQEGIIVFDDCDSVLKDPVSLNLLKGALDSYSRRIISWRADMRDDDLPQSFEFKGRIIFISNLSSNTIDQAIITRSMAVDLNMTTEQKVERMYFIAKQNAFLPDYAQVIKDDALQFISDLKDEIKELSLRTLIQVCKIRNSGGDNWKDLAEYTVAG